jgi:hypothetical protein
MSKKACRFCSRKFNPQGLWRHERRCKKRPAPPIETHPLFHQGEPVNTVSKHPRTLLSEAVEAVWRSLSMSDKLEAIALLEEKQNRY